MTHMNKIQIHTIQKTTHVRYNKYIVCYNDNEIIFLLDTKTNMIYPETEISKIDYAVIYEILARESLK